jgi:hypothetical protein
MIITYKEFTYVTNTYSRWGNTYTADTHNHGKYLQKGDIHTNSTHLQTRAKLSGLNGTI